MQLHPVISFPCPLCDQTAIDRQPERGHMATCPHCRFRTRRPDAKPFTRRDWDATSSPRTLREVWRAVGRELPQRKALLLACGVARIGFDWCHNARFRDAVNYGEAKADGLSQSESAVEIVNGLLPDTNGSTGADWARLGLECVMYSLDCPGEVVAGNYPGVVLGVYRDLLTNPFTQINWNTDWITSTVRDLAAHIYATREFAVMPILADALQDASCDNDHILNHCRADKLHARGCWVLDAILGKT